MEETDTRWRRDPTYADSRPLGSATDHSVMLAAGSATRSFEQYFEPDRLSSLEALVGSTGEFVDWDEPPDRRDAQLRKVTILETVGSYGAQNAAKRKHRVRVELRSQ